MAVSSPTSRRMARLWRGWTSRLAAFGIAVVALGSLLAPWIAPYDPNAMDLFNTLAPPSAEHLLGTDQSGRDVFSRLLYGGRVSMLVGLASMAASILIGTVLGALAGYWGGWVDSLISRATDMMLSVPMFFFLITVLSILGSSMPVLVGAIALSNWMQVARMVRGEVLANRNLAFVESATALGLTRVRTLVRHIIPQSYPTVIVAATLGIAYAILTESALSYLGIGVTPPTPSWGNMLADARSYIWNAPLLTVWPGAAVFVTVMAFNALGDSIRSATDPY